MEPSKTLQLFEAAAQDWTKIHELETPLAAANIPSLPVETRLDLFNYLGKIERNASPGFFATRYRRLFHKQEYHSLIANRPALSLYIQTLKTTLNQYEKGEQLKDDFIHIQEISDTKIRKRYKHLLACQLLGDDYRWYRSSFNARDVNRQDPLTAIYYLAVGNHFCGALGAIENPESLQMLVKAGIPLRHEDFEEAGEHHFHWFLSKAFFAKKIPDYLLNAYPVVLMAAVAEDVPMREQNKDHPDFQALYANVNQRSPALSYKWTEQSMRYTALEFAARSGWSHAVDFLLIQGANPNIGSVPPLYRALKEGHFSIVDRLLPLTKNWKTSPRLCEALIGGFIAAAKQQDSHRIKQLAAMIPPGKTWEVLQGLANNNCKAVEQVFMGLPNNCKEAWQVAEEFLPFMDPGEVGKAWSRLVQPYDRPNARYQPPSSLIRAFLVRSPTLDWSHLYQDKKPLLQLEASMLRKQVNQPTIRPQTFPETIQVKLAQDAAPISCSLLLIAREFPVLREAMMGELEGPEKNQLNLSSWECSLPLFKKLVDDVSGVKPLSDEDLVNPELALLIHRLDARHFIVRGLVNSQGELNPELAQVEVIPLPLSPWSDFQFAWDEARDCPIRLGSVPLSQEPKALVVHKGVLQAAGMKKDPTIPQQTKDETVQALLRFLYTRKPPGFINGEEALSCIQLAKTWGVGSAILAELGTYYLQLSLPDLLQGKVTLKEENLLVGEIDLNAVSDTLKKIGNRKTFIQLQAIIQKLSPLHPPRVKIDACTFLSTDAQRLKELTNLFEARWPNRLS